jgi:hypothetical protein
LGFGDYIICILLIFKGTFVSLVFMRGLYRLDPQSCLSLPISIKYPHPLIITFEQVGRMHFIDKMLAKAADKINDKFETFSNHITVVKNISILINLF